MRRQSLRRGLILCSFLLFPVTQYYFSPYLSVTAAAAGILSGSAAVFGVLFLSSLVLGRAWCGWACPGAGLQEVCFPTQGRPLHRGRWVKYVVFVPWFSALVVLTVLAGGLRRIDLLYRMPSGTGLTEPYSWVIYYIVMPLIVLLALACGRRAFCHYGCWMAPFLVAGTKLKNRFGWPSLHLEAAPAKCTGCRTCTKNCPMSLDVEAMVKKGSLVTTDCILCGECVDGCRTGAIRYAFRTSAPGCPRAKTPARPPSAG